MFSRRLARDFAFMDGMRSIIASIWLMGNPRLDVKCFCLSAPPRGEFSGGLQPRLDLCGLRIEWLLGVELRRIEHKPERLSGRSYVAFNLNQGVRNVDAFCLIPPSMILTEAEGAPRSRHCRDVRGNGRWGHFLNLRSRPK